MITSKVEYLILTLLDLAADGGDGFVRTRDVAERQGIPAKYMPQVMSILSKKGWVESARGPGGGVRLAVDPAEVTIQDVIDVSGDPLVVKACVTDGFRCLKKEGCPLRSVWKEAQDRVTGLMKGTTLSDLMARRSAGR